MFKNIKTKTDVFFYRFIYLWIGMWSINFLGKGTRIALYGGLILLIALILKRIMSRKLLSTSFLMIFMLIISFGITYSLLLTSYEDLGVFRGYRDMFIPGVLYVIGFLSIDKKVAYKDNLEFFTTSFSIAAFALFIYASGNLFLHLSQHGRIYHYNRLMYDMWSGTLTAATTQGSRLILMGAMFPIIIFTRQYKLWYKIAVLITFIITIIETLIMANRTLLVILIVNCFVCFMLYLKQKRNRINNILRLFFFTWILILIFIPIYINDSLGIRSFVEQSNFFIRMKTMDSFSLKDDVRLETWRITLSNIFKYPMGGSRAPIKLTMPHNLWLDVAYTTGIIPFVLLIFITVYYLHLYLSLLTSSETDDDFRIFITSITVSILLNCTVEPILSGHYILFMLFIFQLGLMHGLVHFSKNNNRRTVL